MKKVVKISREKVFESICKATRMNTLGLFIGSGFSKALLLNHPHSKTYSWAELLEKAANDMGITRKILEEGKPYPEVATVLCQEYAKLNYVSQQEAERTLKFKIAEIVNVSPTDITIHEYEEIFKRLNPNWIVTTNYDFIIEQILHEKAFPINPRDSYLKTKDFTPVYHIHGSISDPESIVITNEDYTHTLRISDYRHARLPFLIKESTVLMIGYSLNDLNVLSAVDYSKNIYNNDMPYDTPIIQLLYKKYPDDEPYYSENGIIVQEISDLSEYFAEYLEYEKRFRGEIGKTTKRVNELVEKFTTADDMLVDEFIKNDSYRLNYIILISNFDPEFWYVYSSYTAFLNKCLGVLWNKASFPRAFDEYNNILKLLLDIIENIKYDNVPISFVDYIITKFSDVSYFIGNDLGKSYSAFYTWNNHKGKIPEQFIKEYINRRKDNFDYQYGWSLIENITNREEL